MKQSRRKRNRENLRAAQGLLNQAGGKNRTAVVLWGAVIFALTFIVFSGVLKNGFINFDDGEYVTENLNVQQGLTAESIRWAFSAQHASNWHPLTWLSHIADVELFGLRAGGHHFTSLLLHCCNAVLVLLVFQMMTGDLWRSVFIAAFFALHPLRVESVAWVSERKDVLSTLLWLLTMAAYVNYARQKRRGWYFAALAAFAAGLMAKPMLVTLPCVLLLLDYWPLGRVERQKPLGGQAKAIFALIAEKIPFFIIAAVSIFVTIYAQRSGEAVKDLTMLPLKFRFGNAVISYIEYIGKMLLPTNLAVFYPHPGNGISWAAVFLCGVVLVVIFAAVIVQGKRRPWLITGWLWYFGTLVPVIGLMQVGAQKMADRYTYVPLLGLSMIIAWLIPAGLDKRLQKAITVAAVTVLLIFSICTARLVGYWRNSVTLFEHAAAVTKDNYRAQFNLGKAFSDMGQIDEAAKYYSQAAQIKPAWPEARHNLGVALFKLGRLAEAIEEYEAAIKLNPAMAQTHSNLGVAFQMQGRSGEAVAHFTKAIEINPGYVNAHYNLARSLALQRRTKEAVEHYRRVLELDPSHTAAKQELEQVLSGRQLSM